MPSIAYIISDLAKNMQIQKRADSSVSDFDKHKNKL